MDSWIVKVLKQVVTNMSPNIRASIKSFVDDLEADAAATENPWDDIGVFFLKLILLIK